jgi:hypothetical protein
MNCMKYIRLLLAVVLFINIAGCTTAKINGPTMSEICESYKGRDCSALLERFGPYDYEIKNEKGERVLTWTKQNKNTKFWLNADGYVYHWHSNQRSQAESRARTENIERTVLLITVLVGITSFIVYSLNHADYGLDNMNLGEGW